MNAKAAQALTLVLPGSLDTRTGGTRYDRHIVQGLRARGWQVDVLSVSPRFPWPREEDIAQADAAFAALPEGRLVLADGLCFGTLPALARRHAQRLRWIALVHHPLALESGLDEAQRAHLQRSEREALACARGVIVTSTATAHDLQGWDVAPERIAVVEPGTDPPPPRDRAPPAGTPLRLLCVATLTPRKGHVLLLQALAGLQDTAWALHCVGSTDRDPATTQAVHAAAASLGLTARVHLHGEVDETALCAHFAAAHAFVLASWHEGYGMALAEALAHGLPIVATQGGAIAQTVPAEAGLLVPPGDVPALRDALARVLRDDALRARLAAGACAAGQRLRGWPTAIAQFEAALNRWSTTP